MSAKVIKKAFCFFFAIILFGVFNPCYAVHYQKATMNFGFIEKYLKIVDFATHYTGYYSDNYQTMHFTGISGSGDPYFVLTGFTSNMNGQKVTVNCDNASFFDFPQKDFTVGNYCSYSGENLYDLEGKNFGSCTLGFCMRTKRVSRGTYNFSITYGNTIYKLKIIVTY